MDQKCVRPALERCEERNLPAAFAEPPLLLSNHGVLRATLTEQVGPATVAGQQVSDAWTYNGSYVGPTLVLNPGDLLNVTIVNGTPEITNLHTHGLHVSPLGNGDNALLQIMPGESNEYRIQLPADHPQGLYWYHPHNHGTVNDQIFKGLSGLLVVGRPDGGAPELTGLTQRLLAIDNTGIVNGSIPLPSTAGDVPAGQQTFTINGILLPDIPIRPGESQVFNVANVGNNAFYNLELAQQGTGTLQTVYVVAEDGNPYSHAVPATQLFMAPGKRYSFVVQAGATGGYNLLTTGYFDGFNTWPPTTLGTVTVQGTPATPVPPPTTLTPPNNTFEDLRTQPVAQSRTVIFDNIPQPTGPPDFVINGADFPNNPVFEPRLGTVEEWTLINQADDNHPFHIHVNDFQVISIDGVPYNAQSEQDIVNLAANDVIVVRMKFRDFLGSYVYHCHRVDHEDHGMMAYLTVVPNNPGDVVGAGPGGGPQVNVYNSDGSVQKKFFAYDPSFRGGVAVAVGDVNGDGIPDIVTGAGPGGGPHVEVFDGATNAVLFSFMAYDPTFRGGVSVAAGDVNGDGLDDIITGAGPGGGPHVKAFSGKDGSLLTSFFAYSSDFRGGVNVATGDINGDGRTDVVTGAGPGGGPHVKAFHIHPPADIAPTPFVAEEIESFFAYDPSFRGGVSVATGVVTGIGFADIITGAGPGGGPHVKAFSVPSVHETRHFPPMGAPNPTIGEVLSFFAFDATFSGGVHVSNTYANVGHDFMVGAGSGISPLVRKFHGSSLLTSFTAFDPAFRGGVFVG
jgi:FtsP/CotA-like multicopper oxidase with cupredoxin domain